MKTIRTYPKAAFFVFALSCLFAFALFSCADETIPDIPEPPPVAQAATLSVRVAIGGSTSTRINTGNLDPKIGTEIVAEEEKIHHIEVWVFNGIALEAYANSKGSTNPHIIQDMPITQGYRTIYIAANTDIKAMGSNGTSPITLTELVNHTTLLSQTISDGMIMTADPITVRIGGGHNMLGNPAGMPGHPIDNNLTNGDPLFLYRINARIAIMNLRTDFPNNDNPDAEDYVPYTYFVLEEVIFFHLRKGSAVFPNPWAVPANPTLLWQKNDDTNTFLFGSHVPDDKDYPTYIGSPGILYNKITGVASEEDVKNANADSELLGNSGETNQFGFIAERNEELWAHGINLTGNLLPIQSSTIREMIGNETVSPADPNYRNPFYIYSFENTDGARGGGTFLILKGKLYDEREEDKTTATGHKLFVSEGLQTSAAGNTDDQGNTYYVVWVNRGDMGYTYSGTAGSHAGDGTIRRNTQYNLDITIKRAGTAGTTVINPGTATEVHMFIEPWRSIWRNVEWRP